MKVGPLFLWGVKLSLIAAVVALCLRIDEAREVPFLRQITDEIASICAERDTQWMVVACISIYFIGFNWLNRGRAGQGVFEQGLGLVVFVSALYAYASDYRRGASTLNALVLFFGLMLFQAFLFWQSKEVQLRRPFPVAAAAASLLLLALCISVGVPREPGRIFQYRGQPRWTGFWDNPNMSGVLMAVGVVLAVGWLISIASNTESRQRNAEIGLWVGILPLAAAATVCGIGLVRSYCRGAWLGAVCGLGYLIWSCLRKESHLTPALSPRPTGGEGEPSASASAHLLWCRSCVSRFTRNWVPLIGILVSVLVLAFWNLRHTERIPAGRITSMANANDFSSRNRVAAWEGALQMAAEKPWLGFGWNRQDEVYAGFFCQPKLEGWRAIRTNDYFKLANTLGIPALLCFVAFIGLAMTRNSSVLRNSIAESGEPGTRNSELALACRVGVVVLLVSFWFDGADSGLFRLASGSLFWMLLALGSAEAVGSSRLSVEAGTTVNQ